MNRRGVFLYGYYGCGNVGDDLLILAAVEGIRRHIPDPVFYVRNAGAISSLTGSDANIVLTDIERLLENRAKSKLTRLAAYLAAFKDYIKKCNLLVFGGGTTLVHDKKTNTAMIILLMMCIIAKIYNVKIIGIGLGISSPEGAIARILLKSIIALTSSFCVRDEAAKRECEKIGCRKVMLTADLVFSLQSAFSRYITEPAPGKSGRRCIGISLADSKAVGYPGDSARSRQNLIAQLARFAESLLVRGDTLKLLSFQHHLGADGYLLTDRTILEDLIKEVNGHSGGISIVDVPSTLPAIVSLYATLDAVAGMRYHSLVLAALVGVPFIGLSYDNKVDEICRYFDMPCRPLPEIDRVWLEEFVLSVRPGSIDMELTMEQKRKAQFNFVYFSTQGKEVEA